MNRFFVLLLLGCSLQLQGQTTAELVSYFSFENGSLLDAVDIQNQIVPQGNLEFDCGLGGSSLRFPDGSGAYGVLEGPVNDRFGTGDFTLSFNFHVGESREPQILFSKRDSGCVEDNGITIRYFPLGGRIEADLRENSSKNLQFTGVLTPGKCWYHVALVRRANRVRFYINGVFIEEQTNSTRLNLTNNGPIHLGSSFCPGVGEVAFAGRMDEIRVYIRDLNDAEVEELYPQIDQITIDNPTIFLGQSVPVQLGPSCGTDFSWSPTTGVFNPTDPEPTITPLVAGLQDYEVTVQEDGETCISRDTITINVIDPDDLNCNEIFLPKAFTPNGFGPAANETFGISNPFAVEDLISFELFDQWGGRIFATDDPFSRWDGTLNGQPVNTQNVVYLLRWRCDGEEKVMRGAVSILR